MKKKLIALLLIFLMCSTVSFAVDNNENNVLQVNEVKNTVELENYFNANYGAYIVAGKNSEFEYELKEYMDYVRVKMTSKSLNKISININDEESDLNRLIKTLSQEINKNIKKDISFYIYNNNDSVALKYQYIEKKSIIEKNCNDKKDYNISQMESDLNNNYANYGDVGRELEFEYKLKNTPKFIRLTMEGQNFSSIDLNWKNRNVGNFRDFVKTIAMEIDNEFRKGVRIDIYPEKINYGSLARYEYDENSNNLIIVQEGILTKKDESDNINNKSKKGKVIENNSNHLYSKGRYDLIFKIKVHANKYDTTIEISGENFNKDSLKWLDRDADDFECFIKDIAKSVAKQYPSDLKIVVYDVENKVAGKYEYDIENDTLDIEFEEEYDNNDLNYYYGNYIDEKSSLEFEYKLEHKVSYPQLFEEEVEESPYIAVYLYGQNLKFSNTKWREKDNEKFEDFIEMIAQEVSRKYDSYVILYVLNKYDRSIVRYNYGKIDENRLYPYSDYNGTLESIED